MDFVTKSFRKDETLTSWTLIQHICPHFWAWLLNTLNHAQKWGQMCCKSVQLVRGSSFRNVLLQNPYFGRNYFFFTTSYHRQTYQNHLQPPQRYQNSYFQSHFSLLNISGIFLIFFSLEVEAFLNTLFSKNVPNFCRLCW